MNSLVAVGLWPILLGLPPGPTSGNGGATELVALGLLPKENGVLAVLQGNGILEYRVVRERGPRTQLVVDVLGVSSALLPYYPEENAFLHRILMYDSTPGKSPSGVGRVARVRFQLKRELSYSLEANGSELRVWFFESPSPPPRSEVTRKPSAETLNSLIPPSVKLEPSGVSPALFFHPSKKASGDYRLGPEDVVELRVLDLDQYDRTLRVSGDGALELPLLGRIVVADLTPSELAARVAERLRERYIQNPQVSVFITEFHSQKVSVLGAVRNPAIYSLSGPRRLLQLLAEAGGLDPAAGNTLYVFRQADEGHGVRLAVPLHELLVQGDPRWNIVLQSGDTVTVPPEHAIAVTVLGAVNTPGVHKLPAGDAGTLVKVLGLAGGLKGRASSKGIQIKRAESDGRETMIKVNLEDILSGKSPDILLREGDIVGVRESLF